jgi:hypothetical protein
MKTIEQTIEQIKRLVTDGVNGLVWINFTAETKSGKKYISGHNAMSRNITLCSDGKIYDDSCEYKTGNFELKGHNFNEKFEPVYFTELLLGYEVKFIDNSDMSNPAPSKNVNKYISEFQINLPFTR